MLAQPATTTAEPVPPVDEGLLRAEIRAVLRSAPLDLVRRGRDPRPLHRALGACGLLAPQWPVEYGGRGTSHVAAAVLVEELARCDLPDLAHTLTVQIVGNLLLDCADTRTCQRYLPGFSSGRLLACVLFSEPEAGSDLSALATTAVRDGDGYRLYGVKTHAMFAGRADVGLCLARTGDSLSLFLVPLCTPGVRITPIPTLMRDDFHLVEFEGAFVAGDALIGGFGQGWLRLVQTLVYERTGLDYYAKACHWFHRAVAEHYTTGTEPDLVARGRLASRLHAGGALVRRTLTRLDAGTLSEADAAVAKWYTSELAAEVAWWAAETSADRALVTAGDVDVDAGSAGTLDLALRDAPAQRISGGTSEMMLETIARLRLDEGGRVRA